MLVAIAILGETFPAELARVLGAPLFSVQKIVGGLDRDGIVATRLSGRARVVSLDPRHPLFPELKALLMKIAAAEPAIREAAETRR